MKRRFTDCALFTGSIDVKFVVLTSKFRTAATFVIVLQTISYVLGMCLSEMTSYLVFPVKSQTENKTAPVFLLTFIRS
jgi:hypothetical protein